MTLGGLALAVGMLVDEDCRGREHSPQSYPWQAPDHRDSGGRFSDRHADAGRHAFDLRRTFSGSVAVGSSSLSFSTAGLGRGVRDADLLSAVENAGTSDGQSSVA